MLVQCFHQTAINYRGVRFRHFRGHCQNMFANNFNLFQNPFMSFHSSHHTCEESGWELIIISEWFMFRDLQFEQWTTGQSWSYQTRIFSFQRSYWAVWIFQLTVKQTVSSKNCCPILKLPIQELMRGMRLRERVKHCWDKMKTLKEGGKRGE